MLDIKDKDYFEAVQAFAHQVGATDALQRSLDYLSTYGERRDEQCLCELWRDFAPHSFNFTLKWKEPDGSFRNVMSGGLIYSGPGVPSDGSAPSFSVSLNADAAAGRTHLWSVHT